MKKQWGLLLSPTVFLNTIFGIGAILGTPEKQGCSAVDGVGWQCLQRLPMCGHTSFLVAVVPSLLVEGESADEDGTEEEGLQLVSSAMVCWATPFW